MNRPNITGLDHIVLNVSDIDRSLAFYRDILGLKPERLAEFKAGKAGFPSVRVTPETIIDLFPIQNESETRHGAEAQHFNLNHFCMVIDRQSFTEVVAYLQAKAVTVHQGPVSRWGARGQATSIYFFDPDRNEIELRCY